MITTGIVRHMDDLGRIVIPKEIRRKVGFMEGDPFEIYITDKHDGVVLKKYSFDLKSDIKALCVKLCENAGSYAKEQDIRKKCNELMSLIEE